MSFTPYRGAGFAVVLTAALGAAAPSAAQDAAPAVTFTKDVAPILQRSCQECHRTGSIAPMSLLTYDETRPWARSIREKVVTRAMPPWYIDKNIGVQGFKYDYSLSDDEIATVAAWSTPARPAATPRTCRRRARSGTSPSGRSASPTGSWSFPSRSWSRPRPQLVGRSDLGLGPHGRPLGEGGGGRSRRSKGSRWSITP